MYSMNYLTIKTEHLLSNLLVIYFIKYAEKIQRIQKIQIILNIKYKKKGDKKPKEFQLL